MWSSPPLEFADDRCGPGSLAGVLTVLGPAVAEDALAREIPTVKGGVLSVDLVLAARRRGFEASLVEGNAALLGAELRAGRAAILMLRLLDMPGQGKDVYHYVVVDGLDAERGLFRFQYGDGKVRWASLGAVEGSWKAAGHALVRVAGPSPGAPPAAADLAAGLRAGLALEQAGRPAEAADHYRRLSAVHPESVRVHVNLGNAEAAAGRPDEAEAAYRSALRISPRDRDAGNNLAWLLLTEGTRLQEAETLAVAASEAPGPDRASALDTLGRVRLARGDCARAAEAFTRALEADPPPPLRAKLEQGQEAARRCPGADPTRDR